MNTIHQGTSSQDGEERSGLLHVICDVVTVVFRYIEKYKIVKSVIYALIILAVILIIHKNFFDPGSQVNAVAHQNETELIRKSEEEIADILRDINENINILKDKMDVFNEKLDNHVNDDAIMSILEEIEGNTGKCCN